MIGTIGLKRKREIDSNSRKHRKVNEAERGQGEDITKINSLALDRSSETQGKHVEDDEWDDVVDVPAMDAEPASILKSKTQKPPTGDELRAIKDADDLFRSSSFKLQIDALLPNVRPKKSRLIPLERFLLALHSFIMGIPPSSLQHPLEASQKLLKKGVSVPYVLPLPTEETNWKVGFEKPSEIYLVGSWANKVSVKCKDGVRYGVDLAVEMPDSLFQEKDYLNARFFQKRAFYLATIAAAIKSNKSEFDVDVLYENLRGDPRLTKIVLIPKPDGSTIDFSKLNAQVCIIPVVSKTSPIPPHRLSPSHSNIRISSPKSANDGAKAHGLPTPNYNTALLLSMFPRPNLLATHILQQETSAYTDALTLLRIWANQRGYSEGTRMCVRGFEGCGTWWSSLLEMLITGEERIAGTKGSKRKSLGRGLSSYQLFKAALDFIAKHKFENEPIFVRSKSGQRPQFPPDAYKNLDGPVFVDSSSLVNLLSGIPQGSLNMLRYDANLTLETLNKTSISREGGSFANVFLIDHRDLPTRFDTILRVDVSSLNLECSSLDQVMDYGSPFSAIMADVDRFLRRALDDRALAVAILHPSSSPRSLHQAHPSYPKTVFIGIVHNQEHAFRLVDRGPAAGEDQSIIQNFRHLWGKKAELRRFKDGHIIESVVWDVKTADERAHIPALITRHILDHHFGLSDNSVHTWQKAFDSVLRLPKSISSIYLENAIPAGFKNAITAFDNIIKTLKSFDDGLPLSLMNISPTSELLRYTSVFSPASLSTLLTAKFPPNALYLPHIEIILEFEKSTRWPDELKAIQKIKLAIYERAASLLMKSVDGLEASVVVGDGVHNSEILDMACLEIVTREGWAFRARIWNDREATLLDRIISGENDIIKLVPKAKGVTQDKKYHDAIEAKEVYTRRFIHAPRHHRAIASLCHTFPAFAGTTRLVKRWLASHWFLSSHVSQEVVEIICAKFFIGDGQNQNRIADAKMDPATSSLVPGTKERGFASVLRFLKDWNWEDGLFVPLYGPAADVAPESSVKASGRGVWTVSTEFDKGGRVWTTHGPDIVVARRIRVLAGATWTSLQTVEQGNLNIRSIFLHPTKDYDVLVRLDPAILPRYYHNVDINPNFLVKSGVYTNAQKKPARVKPGFDPAQMFVDDLQRVYADTMKVFYDPFGGAEIGIVWEPSLKQPRPFRVLGRFSSAPLNKEKEIDKPEGRGLVKLNEDAVVQEIERLGTSLIQTITLQSGNTRE